MSWRIVSVSSMSKLDYKMDYLVVRNREAVTRIHLSEISILLLESTAISLTAYLLRELDRHKMQKSVYSKLALTQTAADAIMEAVRKKKPARGTIQALMVTEKQYGRIEYIIGAHTGDVLDTDERFVEL